MANSQFEYVRNFEQADPVLPNTWIVVRLDGRAFHKFTKQHKFEKPNDRRALELMNAAADAVMRDLIDIRVAYGQSDEFSFVFHPSTLLFDRRASKLCSTILSIFTAAYIYLWPRYFSSSPLELCALPTFDARAVVYPSLQNLRDYLSWRQVDCHINNLYNTTFWALVEKGGLGRGEAEEALKGTVSSDKNEILFSRFGINYNNELEIFKKGSVVYRDLSDPATSTMNTIPAPSNSQPHPESDHQQGTSVPKPTTPRPSTRDYPFPLQPTSAPPTQTKHYLTIPPSHSKSLSTSTTSKSTRRKRSTPSSLYLSPSAPSTPTGRPPTPGTPKAFPSVDSPAEAPETPSPLSEAEQASTEVQLTGSPARTVVPPPRRGIGRSASMQGLSAFGSGSGSGSGSAQSSTAASRARSREKGKERVETTEDGENMATPTPSRPVTQDGARAKQKAADPQSRTQLEKAKKRKAKAVVVVEHVDIIKDGFWQARPWILG